VSEPAEILRAAIAGWLDDPESDVVYAEEVFGRWAVRMHQETRDATTVWWDVGERSVRAEAYLFPPPENGVCDVYRLCLIRNAETWRVRYALDKEGAVVLRARIAVEEVDRHVLDLVLAELYQQVELSFGPVLRLATREKTR
jgi:hypothetical protein